ncbi:MAG: 50S ribosomal protein L25 [candidate division Zixibacteria bacterium HGW-Zixibacteria-1]|nr:MAG: 50S ribosomal protein L25 [candidate division Zixibacteria bacterium HGW-Zixibacteria-1]
MDEIKLIAERRDGVGKGTARKLRARGLMPGVVYGPETEAQPVSINIKELAALLRAQGGTGKLIDLNLNDEKEPRKVIIRELQREPVTGGYEHVDFYQVSMKKKLNMTVRVHLTGTPEGVKLGGILQHILRDLEIACLPIDIPDRIELDVSKLEIGDSIHVSYIQLDKVDILTPPVRTIVTVVPPTVIKVAEAAAGEGAEGEAAEGEAAEGAAEGEEKKEETEKK